ncbi:MAG: hypothetical protein A3D24_02035 [Candidatus Blackburnbacteria bacterium RIFCSPHIGHO2_02_FULL_39_13]|uniref:Glycosyl transferase family 1 domain-containing protein n=1 Tax=Candidatus Blackburnbacteria bacterium RIFCSPLOWO2_01_FULL_40_20 TaxID=1797519 RepID=A0A1G1VDV7_9BACT|nr:MAG: glycosyl transferase family 1 protein [Microgenomates group bacterium GW2011_GWA2_39_19]OGY06932.1 MAG: hypothetical protein A2694_04085 [Candidatus Blackburnbacteria bacterium RIFCSPHIGHO2_01_FULL_40_17]OGY09178.1 MAG: hypothetical protein A3D24_02035 [Candidatus Blackburnbacteria bacterium RIFCSPHIGHO2_02_FULL_39_13]OGY13585.1 MAG: hypothetical protein A3A77_04320 [Candidatus Blackburnbacteria bacterium RIFCSPLOWO2_01_FULL_40_20]HBL52237.1 hypothetical protein [Candidatus Blackburnbac
MAKIGIDARLWGVKHTGIGRYVEELVKSLQQIDKENEYVLFCRNDDTRNIPEVKGWKKVIADINHYSLKEQFTLHKVYRSENLDLLHVPHFNVPIFYKGKFVVTIHDLLWHDLKGLSVTTLPAPAYIVKYFAYRSVVGNAIKNSQKIIVPSNFIKNDLISKFSLPDEKIVVTYEGVSESRSGNNSESVLKEYGIKKPYLFYVGGLYPHKNVERVVNALTFLRKEQKLSDLKLVVVGSRNVFQDRFKKFLKETGTEDVVNIIGGVDDRELSALYKNSEAFVYATLSEGFGLPGLEAMAWQTPVLCSDIPVLKEIYKDAAIYFDPSNIISISQSIQKIMCDKNLRSNLIKKGVKFCKTYSWTKMARETLGVYNQCINSHPTRYLQV